MSRPPLVAVVRSAAVHVSDRSALGGEGSLCTAEGLWKVRAV